MKTAGSLSLLLLVVLSISSFYLPVDDSPYQAAVVADRPGPAMDFAVDIRFLIPLLKYSRETGVPIDYACRLFAYESTGNPMAGRWLERSTNWLGAAGLGQLMPANTDFSTDRGRWFAAQFNDGNRIDPYDPETAIRVSLRYLAWLHTLTGTWQTAARAYNGGIGHYLNPRRWGPWQEESVVYSKEVVGQ